jgi:hypothetical protein
MSCSPASMSACRVSTARSRRPWSTRHTRSAPIPRRRTATSPSRPTWSKPDRPGLPPRRARLTREATQGCLTRMFRGRAPAKSQYRVDQMPSLPHQ